LEPAERAYRQALAVSERVAEEAGNPAAPPGSVEEVSALQHLITSRLRRTNSQYPEAAASYREALRTYRQLVATEPARVDHRRRLCETALQLAWFLATCPDKGVQDRAEAVSLGLEVIQDQD